MIRCSGQNSYMARLDANAAQPLDVHRWSVARYTDAARLEQCDHSSSGIIPGQIAADCVAVVLLPLALF
jgi:hypothetical protein